MIIADQYHRFKNKIIGKNIKYVWSSIFTKFGEIKFDSFSEFLDFVIYGYPLLLTPFLRK